MATIAQTTTAPRPDQGIPPSWPAVMFSCAIHLLNGINLPYFPVFLEEARGMSGGQIALIMALATMLRVVAGPLIAAWAEGSGFRRSMGLTSLAVLAGYAALFPLSDFAPIAALATLAYALFGSTMPLAEAALMATTGRERGRISYGFARALGSSAFILANLAGGAILSVHGPESALTMIIGAAVILAVFAACLDGRPRHMASAPKKLLPAMVSGLGLFRGRRLLLLTLAGAAMQASHAYYYNFGSVIWVGQGIGEDLIGVLWALGVVAEIALLFAAAGRLGRMSAEALIAIGAIGGIIRWTVLGFAPGLMLVYPVQLLHAATFAATHLGTLKVINDEVDEARIPVAVSINAALAFGPAMAIAALAGGATFDALAKLGPVGEARGYWLMAGLAALGLAATVAAKLTTTPTRVRSM